MHKIRILIVTHAPLSPKYGAGQMAINLAEAFKKQGHDVTFWSPHPMPNFTRWWQYLETLPLMRSRLDSFLSEQEPFDVIDCAGVLITNSVVTKSKLTVARSVQPDIPYLASGLLDGKGIKKIILLPFNLFSALVHIFLLLQGWSRATYILCLGSLELKMINRWFPWWRSKSLSYVNAISKDEQVEFTKIRLNRVQQDLESTRFIWIGRWAAHKGIKELVEFICHRTISHPKDTFTIAGCDKNAEKDFPDELIKSGQLRIVPSFDRSEIYSLIANHDAGLFTSKIEGWGLILNEMLESGMPVFATQVGGVPDLQPFCKNIYPFPPPDKLTFEYLKSCQISENYYNFFVWDKIAETYANQIFVNFYSINE